MTLTQIGQLAIDARTLRRQTEDAYRQVVENKLGFGGYQELDNEARDVEQQLATAIDQFVQENAGA